MLAITTIFALRALQNPIRSINRTATPTSKCRNNTKCIQPPSKMPAPSKNCHPCCSSRHSRYVTCKQPSKYTKLQNKEQKEGSDVNKKTTDILTQKLLEQYFKML